MKVINNIITWYSLLILVVVVFLTVKFGMASEDVMWFGLIVVLPVTWSLIQAARKTLN